jgi:hypothetical protein
MPYGERAVRRDRTPRQLIRGHGGKYERNLVGPPAPRHGSSVGRRYDADVLDAVWVALGVAVVASVAATTFVVSRALRAWRSFRSLVRGASRSFAELEAKAAATERKAGVASDRSTRLAESVTRLEQSLETLAVLREAAAEAGEHVRRVRGLVPRK